MRYEAAKSAAKSFSISGALPPNRLVRLSTGVLDLASATANDVLGATPCNIAGSDPSGPVLMRSTAQTYEVEASGSVSVGLVYQPADGKVAASGTVITGVAIVSAGDGELVELMPL